VEKKKKKTQISIAVTVESENQILEGSSLKVTRIVHMLEGCLHMVFERLLFWLVRKYRNNTATLSVGMEPTCMMDC